MPKKIVGFLSAAIMPVSGFCAYGECKVIACSSDSENEYNTNMIPPNATEYKAVCYTFNGASVAIGGNETKCKSGYTRVCGLNSANYGAVLQKTCTNAAQIASNFCSCDKVCGASSCTDCEDTDWSITGGHVYMTAKCELVGDSFSGFCQCKRTFETKCNNRYYGDKTVMVYGDSGNYSTCKLCPNVTADDGGYSNSAALVTDCYAPANQQYWTQEGSFIYENDCYYKN